MRRDDRGILKKLVKLLKTNSQFTYQENKKRSKCTTWLL